MFWPKDDVHLGENISRNGAPNILALSRQLGKIEVMTLQHELSRFDAAIAVVVPEAVEAMGLGLSESGIEELRRAVAPLRLGEDIEALYRWHNGISGPVFGGKRFLPAAEIVLDREVQVDVLERPPAWLQFTDGPDFYFATLDLPGHVPDPVIWSGDTHDIMLCRMHDSLESMIGSFNDMAFDTSETLQRRKELLLGSLRNGGNYRLQRSPGSFTYPGPPEGTFIMLFDEGTPESWLRSLGITSGDLLPRGATMTIAELRLAARQGEVSGTVQGRTTNVGGPVTAVGFTIDDGTGTIRLVANNKVTHLGPVSQTMVEADVIMAEDGSCHLLGLRRSPEWTT
jgi:hypothetical protein